MGAPAAAPGCAAVDSGEVDAELSELPVANLLVTTDGSSATRERLRTALERAAPWSSPATIGEAVEEEWRMLGILLRMVDVGIILCLIIAGAACLSVAGGLIDASGRSPCFV